MKKCKFCAEEIQDDAVVCKHCNRDLEEKKIKIEKKKIGMGKKILLAIFFFFVVMIIISMVSQSPSSNTNNTTPGNPDEIEAVVIAQNYVEAHLKYPADSEFPGMFVQDYLVKIDGNTYTVTNWVDSANGFGAKERTYYQITLEYLGGDPVDPNSWKEVDFKFSK